MDVCVCGAQVPFMRGGAEQLLDNLVSALTAAGHHTDLVRLPTTFDRRRLFDAALAWRFAPVQADLVIATNFPSYFVRHPRKVVWLLHQHRSAYDGADAPWSDFGLDDDGLEAQRLLWQWDNRALGEAERLFAVSEVVADRLARFNGLSAPVLTHPPPHFDRLRSRADRRGDQTSTAPSSPGVLPGERALSRWTGDLSAQLPIPGPAGDYVFCATRLEGNKRPELIIEAMAHMRSATRVVIAGHGGMEASLRRRARDLGVGERLALLGFVDDDELIERYAGALAVVYVPFDEDYGYVTLQAFAAGKAVITATDSGGVLEWVEDGVSGVVTDGTPAGLAAAIDRLAGDPDEARRMGEAGRQRVQGLSWGPVVAALTDEPG